MRNLRKTNPGAYKIIVGLVCFSAFLFIVLVIGMWRVESFYRSEHQRDCHTRQEGRDGLRETLFDLVLSRPDPLPDEPGHQAAIPPAEYTEGQARVAARIAPGGKLEPIVC